MSTLVTVVHYKDAHHAFLTPPEERIASLLDGCLDHFLRPHPGDHVTRTRYALALCETGERLHPDVTLGAIHYEAGKPHDLRLVELPESADAEER